MVDYNLRVVDTELDALINDLPAISIEGPKGVGKTVTAQRRAKTVLALDDPATVDLLVAEPSEVENAPTPVLLDEWQRFPRIWDIVRRNVDQDRSAGRFILTGSATPTTAPTHSGAGRIVRIRMRPMALAEREFEQPSVSVQELLSGSRPNIRGTTKVRLRGYTNEIINSGFPGIRGLSPRARRAQLDAYIDRIVERDFPEQGHLVRRPATLRAWLTAYAAATSTTASYNAIRHAATSNKINTPAKSTTIIYRDVLEQLWLLDPVPGWFPIRNSLGRLAQAPKHQLADPALAARLLGLTNESLLTGGLTQHRLRDGMMLGALFESLIALNLKVYAQAAEATVHHLRTRNGDHEIDFILERDDHRVLAIEVKLSSAINDRDVTHLRWLQEHLGDDLLDAVIVTTGQYAYRRTDGIAVIPAALLGP